MEQRIAADLEDSYGIYCRQITPVTGGWLNKKWKIKSNKGTLLIKQYSNQRFDKNKLRQIESALQRQMLLEKDGVPCPHILPYHNRAIRMLDDDTAYMVMGFCSGRIESNDAISDKQLRSLGSACGRMHEAFSKLVVEGVHGYQADGARILRGLWQNFYRRADSFSAGMPQDYMDAVIEQKEILQNLEADFFDRLPKGIGHEDFSPDNMLFFEDRLSAIIDFDRNQYGFVWHDIGRAILSFALDAGRINLKKVRAFMEGYSVYRPLTVKDIVDALRIAWCVEIPWWIQPEFFIDASVKTTRFKDEMRWLTKHWFLLELIMSAN